MDRITKEQRRKTMRAVKSKDSIMEQRLSKALFKKGFRYRKHYSKLEGKPDIVFVSKKIVIFCDSEFWHGYDWDNQKHDIKSNREFWWSKIERNIQRDQEVTNKLEKEGWTVLRFWGKEIKENFDNCVASIAAAIKSANQKK